MKKQLNIFQEQIEAFFQLGKIKSDMETELVLATQNRKGFGLNSPYLFVVNFHQKFFRVYVAESNRLINPRNLYLKEGWVYEKNIP